MPCDVTKGGGRTTYQKWIRKLLGFDFEVQYKPRVANLVADALWRKTDEQVACALWGYVNNHEGWLDGIIGKTNI